MADLVNIYYTVQIYIEYIYIYVIHIILLYSDCVSRYKIAYLLLIGCRTWSGRPIRESSQSWSTLLAPPTAWPDPLVLTFWPDRTSTNCIRGFWRFQPRPLSQVLFNGFCINFIEGFEVCFSAIKDVIGDLFLAVGRRTLFEDNAYKKLNTVLTASRTWF